MGYTKKDWIENELKKQTMSEGPVPDIKDADESYSYKSTSQSEMADRSGIFDVLSLWVSRQYAKSHLEEEGGYNGI